jgi:hypothetical protein
VSLAGLSFRLPSQSVCAVGAGQYQNIAISVQKRKTLFVVGAGASMIPKSVQRFSEKIMLHQQPGAG